MEKIFLVFIVIVVGLFGGALYLIYLPAKIALKRKGKLSKRLDNQINAGYLLFLVLLCAYLFYQRDYRTPSKNVFEDITEIKLPYKFEVLKDEYLDMWQDYAVHYEVKIGESDAKKFMTSIVASPLFFEKTSTHPKDHSHWNTCDSLFCQTENGKPVWCKENGQFRFNLKKEKQQYYSARFDTLSNDLKFDYGKN